MVHRELADQPYQYLYRVADGLERSRDYFRERLTEHAVPSVQQVKEAHCIAFREVYPFAGEFRTRDRHVGPGDHSFVSAYYSKIEPELAKLEERTCSLLDRAKGPVEKAKTLAFYHEQFERIHPFIDGNGRLGRTILEVQVEKSLGRTMEQHVDRAGYEQAMREAHQGDFRALTFAATGLKLPESQREVQFKLELWPISIVKTLSDGSNLNLTAKSVKEAEVFEQLKVSERLEAHVLKTGQRQDPAILINTTYNPPILDHDSKQIRQDLQRKLTLER